MRQKAQMLCPLTKLAMAAKPIRNNLLKQALPDHWNSTNGEAPTIFD
jgi:hypothetical protein